MHFFIWSDSLQWARASSITRFLDHIQRHTTFSRTPLDEISSSQRPLPNNKKHSQQTNVQAPDWIQTHNLSRRAAAELRLRPRGHWDRPRTPFDF